MAFEDWIDKAIFIEFLGGVDGVLRPYIYGISAFDTPADELTACLTNTNAGKVVCEKGYSYSFLNICIGVYREITPLDIEEMTAEMKADGIPTENNEELAYEKRRASHWATIGTGIAGYYGH